MICEFDDGGAGSRNLWPTFPNRIRFSHSHDCPIGYWVFMRCTSGVVTVAMLAEPTHKSCNDSIHEKMASNFRHKNPFQKARAKVKNLRIMRTLQPRFSALATDKASEEQPRSQWQPHFGTSPLAKSSNSAVPRRLRAPPGSSIDRSSTE